jgi:pyrimidine deaminase RibD-like protein
MNRCHLPAMATSYGRYTPDITQMCSAARNSEMYHKHCSKFLGSNIMGYNRHNKRGDSTHAEVAAITNFISLYRKKGYNDRQIRSKLGKHTLFIIRVNNDRESAKTNPCRYSMPCSDCICALKNFGVKNVVVTSDNGELLTIRCSQLTEGVTTSGRRPR